MGIDWTPMSHGACGFMARIIQDVPNLSLSMAKRTAKKVSSIAMNTVAAVREQRIDPFCLVCAVDGEREIDAAHRLKAFWRNISSHELRLPDLHGGVLDGLFPAGPGDGLVRLLGAPHQHRDLSTEMLFIETKGLFAVAPEVQVRVESHVSANWIPQVNCSLRLARLSSGLNVPADLGATSCSGCRLFERIRVSRAAKGRQPTTLLLVSGQNTSAVQDCLLDGETGIIAGPCRNA